MNNIQEKDWADEDWGGHSGMVSNPYDEDEPPHVDKESSAVADQADGNQFVCKKI